MNETLWHAACWLILGIACLYAGSEPPRISRDVPVRDILFPKPSNDTTGES